MTAEVADVDGGRVVAAGGRRSDSTSSGTSGQHLMVVIPGGAAGVVAADDDTFAGSSLAHGRSLGGVDHIDVGSGISSSKGGAVAGALEDLFNIVDLDTLEVHTHEAAEQKFVTGQFGVGTAVARGAGSEDLVGRFGHFVVGSGGVGSHIIFVDAGVHEFTQTDLFEFADAVGITGAFAGGGEGGQQHGGQDRDDSDNHQKRYIDGFLLPFFRLPMYFIAF